MVGLENLEIGEDSSLPTSQVFVNLWRDGCLRLGEEWNPAKGYEDYKVLKNHYSPLNEVTRDIEEIFQIPQLENL